MRIFVGIELPEDLREKIFVLGQTVGKGRDIKLVEKENLHLTLLFLGKRTEEEIEKIVGVLRGLGEFGGITLKLEKMELFPSEKFSRGIWLSVGGERKKLFSLYKKIVDEFLKAGLKLDDSCLRFSPHITLGRFRKRLGGLGDLRGLRENFLAKKVTLFESRLSNKGPTHIKIASFGLYS